MKAFATWVMKGRMQAVIAATVFAVLALLITPLALLSVAVVVLTVMRQGWREGALVVGSALLAIAGLGGLLFQMPIAVALIGAMLWLPAAILGGVMGRTGSLRYAIEAAALGGAIIVVLQYVLLGDPAAFWAGSLDALLTARLQDQAIDPAQIEALVAMVSVWMAGGVGAAWFLGTTAALSLARYWAALIDEPGAFGAEFRELRFSRWLLIVVPLLLIVGVVLSGGKPGLLAQLFMVGTTVYLIQGISVAHGLVAAFGGSTAWLVGLYLLVILVAPHGATLVSAAGYADGWVDFRARARARRSGADDN